MDDLTKSSQALKMETMKPRKKFTIDLFKRKKSCSNIVLVLVLLDIIPGGLFFLFINIYGTIYEETMFIDTPFVPTQHELLSLYDNWLAKHHVNYTDNADEKERRFEIFQDNLWFILDHNSNSNVTYKLGLNRFAHLTNDEYRSMFLGGKVVRDNKQLFTGDDRYRYGSGDELPESIDWRDKGAVTPVKDQGQNGGSWAYSTVGAVEGINHIVTGELIPLSEQELVDCHKGFNNSGGRQIDYAFEFILKSGGIHNLNDYPYRGIEGQCDQNRVNNFKVVTITGHENVPPNDENSLKKAVAHQPVSVSVEAGGRAFQLYESGVFTGLCGTELEHGVLAVGYGTEDGKDYWIVRNSWGPNWGENGYIRLERNVASTNTGKCGIAMQPSYPTKTGVNPPKPDPSPPSPVKPYLVCDDYYSCPASTTCCCVYKYGEYCFGWGCCPLESATCCDDHSSCCPQEYPVCDLKAHTCLLSKNSPIGIKALKRSPARPNWTPMNVARKFFGA